MDLYMMASADAQACGSGTYRSPDRVKSFLEKICLQLLGRPDDAQEPEERGKEQSGERDEQW